MDHLITIYVGGPCAGCGRDSGERTHVHGLAIYCADCCPACRPAPALEGPAHPVAGEQESLFPLIEYRAVVLS